MCLWVFSGGFYSVISKKNTDFVNSDSTPFPDYRGPSGSSEVVVCRRQCTPGPGEIHVPSRTVIYPYLSFTISIPIPDYRVPPGTSEVVEGCRRSIPGPGEIQVPSRTVTNPYLSSTITVPVPD